MSNFIKNKNKGMTLVEVMMAVAVLGIILLFITQMTSAGSEITAGNRQQAEMMELARAEMEKVKADLDSYPAGYDQMEPVPYPLGSEESHRHFTVRYEINEGVIRITVWPVAEPGEVEQDSGDKYALVSWIP